MQKSATRWVAEEESPSRAISKHAQHPICLIVVLHIRFILIPDGSSVAPSSPFQNLPVELVHKIFVGAAEEDTLTALSIGSTCTTARKWIADIWTRDVWMDISIDGKAIGTLIMRLYDDVTPKTARNFRELCKGQLKDKTGTKLSYQGCSFHRALRSFLVQAGDIDGKGGQSIYNGPFHDENYTYKFDRRGVIAMANNGPSTNTSQFFITMSRATWLTNHVRNRLILSGLQRGRHGKIGQTDFDRFEARETESVCRGNKSVVGSARGFDSGGDAMFSKSVPLDHIPRSRAALRQEFPSFLLARPNAMCVYCVIRPKNFNPLYHRPQPLPHCLRLPPTVVCVNHLSLSPESREIARQRYRLETLLLHYLNLEPSPSPFPEGIAVSLPRPRLVLNQTGKNTMRTRRRCSGASTGAFFDPSLFSRRSYRQVPAARKALSRPLPSAFVSRFATTYRSGILLLPSILFLDHQVS